MRRVLLLAALLALTAVPAAAVSPGASGSLTVRNGAVDLVEADGGDSTSGTTRATNKPKLKQRRADDCTAQTDGEAGEVCIDDVGGVLVCIPTSGGCDTAAEWHYVSRQLAHGTTVVSGDCDAAAETGRIFVDTDAAAGARVHACFGTSGWIPIDNPFGTQIDGDEIAASFAPPGGTVIQLDTNDASLVLPVVASNGSTNGQVWVDSTTGKVEWYSSVSAAGVREAATTNYASTFTASPRVNTNINLELGSSAEHVLVSDGTQATLRATTSDGSDSRSFLLTAGGGASVATVETRGAYIYGSGNESASTGTLLLSAGNVSGGRINFITGGSAISTPRLTIEDDGDLCVLLGTCTRTIGIGGTATRTLGLEPNTTSNTAGSLFAINAGAATSAATDKDGGVLMLSPGAPTGTGRSYTTIRGWTTATSTGTSYGSAFEAMNVGAFKALTDNSPITLVNATAASNTVAAGVIHYAVECRNASSLTVEVGEVYYHVINDAGSIGSNVVTEGTTATAGSDASTVTTTWAISAANPAAISLNADCSLTSLTTGYPRVRYTVQNFTGQAIAIQ